MISGNLSILSGYLHLHHQILIKNDFLDLYKKVFLCKTSLKVPPSPKVYQIATIYTEEGRKNVFKIKYYINIVQFNNIVDLLHCKTFSNYEFHLYHFLTTAAPKLF